MFGLKIAHGLCVNPTTVIHNKKVIYLSKYFLSNQIEIENLSNCVGLHIGYTTRIFQKREEIIRYLIIFSSNCNVQVRFGHSFD